MVKENSLMIKPNKIGVILSLSLAFTTNVFATTPQLKSFFVKTEHAYIPIPQEAGLEANVIKLLEDKIEEGTIGLGFDTVMGELKTAMCVELKSGTPHLDKPSPVPDVKFSINKIDDINSFVSATEFTASAAYKGGAGSADARSKYLFSNELTSYRSFAMHEVDVKYPDQKHVYHNFKLSKFGKNIYKKGGAALFRYYCGDAFVIGFNKGGIFSTMISVTSSTSQEQSEADLAVSASSPSGKIEGGQKEFFDKRHKSNQLKIEVIRKALEESIPDISNIDGLISYALAYPEKLAKLPILPIRNIYTADYLLLLLEESKEMGPTPDWIKTLGAEFEYLLDLTRYRANLVYIRDHKDQYVTFDEGPLAEQIKIVTNLMNSITDWAAECYRTIGKSCIGKKPPKISIPPLSPLRADAWITSLHPRISVPQPIGESPKNHDMKLEAKGHWYNHGFDVKDLKPITFSTRIKIVNKANGNEQFVNTQLSLPIPRNSALFFEFLDSEHKDNNRYESDPASIRLGSQIDPYILGITH